MFSHQCFQCNHNLTQTKNYFECEAFIRHPKGRKFHAYLDGWDGIYWSDSVDEYIEYRTEKWAFENLINIKDLRKKK